MGFWQNLVECYDSNAEALGITYPLSTTSISNIGQDIFIIVLDIKGNLIKVDKIEEAKKSNKGRDIIHISIPVSEESMSRSNNIAPHPVFDQYEYLQGTGLKFDAYLTELSEFATSKIISRNNQISTKVNAIYRYIQKRTVEKDLEEVILKNSHKTNIIFKIESSDPQLWQDKIFFDIWHQYYLNKKRFFKTQSSDSTDQLHPQRTSNDSLDYITGTMQPPAGTHPKKIFNGAANAKLISSNDMTNFTFRGMFLTPNEAFSVGYDSSQKAHQFLRYIIKNRGLSFDEQVMFSYTIGSEKNITQPPIVDNCIQEFLQNEKITEESNEQTELKLKTGINYAMALRKALQGSFYSNILENHIKTAVVILDAPGPGRLSITFYREMDTNEYIENIASWHDSCKWYQEYWDSKEEKFITYIGAPSIKKIIETVYGKINDQNLKIIKKRAREKLLHCIFSKEILPLNFVRLAIQRVSNPMAITMNNKFHRRSFEQYLSATCAMIRKYYKQNGRGDFNMEVQHDLTDRSYLYGRLLGAADKLEDYALFKKGKDRNTTALRYMRAFTQRPYSTWKTIYDRLNPYIQETNKTIAVKEIELIINKFPSIEIFATDTPLEGSYLLGYYHERAYIDSLIKKTKIIYKGEQ